MKWSATIRCITRRRFLLGLFLLVLLPTTYYLLPTPEVHALDVGVNVVEAGIDLPGTDIRVIIARIINVALTLLGIVVVGFILYGGFIWMTAGGDEEKVATAKRIITQAVIGLAIVLSAWAITRFVLSRLIEATTGGGTTIVDDGGGGRRLPAGAFAVRSISPQNPAPPQGFPMNVVVRIRMNQNVDPATVPGSVTVETVGGEAAAGEFDVAGSLIRFVPSTSCSPFEGDNCFAANTTFRVTLRGGLRSESGRSVTCGGLAPSCAAEFSVGEYIDVADPQVVMTVPAPMQSIQSDFQDVRALASDDSMVSEVGFFDGEALIDVDAPPSGSSSFEATAVWETAEVPANECRLLTAEATDVAENETASAPIMVVVRPAHCFNGEQDDGETGLDCGGDLENNSENYCGRCAGETCGAIPVDGCNLFCRSGSCIDGFCINLPRIDNVERLDVGPGSYVTIEGEFFGASPGTVTFLGEEGTDDDVVAALATCEGAWSPTRIIAVVPSDERLTSGPLAVTTDQGTDTTADSRGFVGNFVPTDLLIPGLCAVRPASGRVDANFTLVGTGFGEAQGGSKVSFDDREVTVLTAWGAETISGRVPAIDPGLRDVRVTVSGEASNPVGFTVLGPEAGTDPVITSIVPREGPPGTYVTIFGTNFGNIGQVIFRNPESGALAIGDTDFPEQCEGGFWEQSQITVKVPETYTSGAPDGTPLEEMLHELVVRRSGVSEATSAAEDFTVTDGTPSPGLCGMTPVSGPANVLVQFFGEGFGTTATTAVRFFENAMAVPGPSFAEENEARATVPDGATTGPVTVEVSTAASERNPTGASNPRNFRVANCREDADVCEAGFECCGNGSCAPEGQCFETASGAYAWYFSTGAIPQIPRLVFGCSDDTVPSPAPYRVRTGGEEVCVNALVTGRFTIPMDLRTFGANTVTLSVCPGGAEGACAAPEPGRVEPVGDRAFQLISDSLLPDTWYEVQLGTSIRGAPETGGVALAEDSSCGAGIAYCWRFKTRENTDTCAVGSLQVEPQDFTATAALERVVYTALPRAARDICLMLNPDYIFEWSATDPAGRATLTVGVPEGVRGVPASPEDHRATASAIVETPPGNPVDVRATIPVESVTDVGLLTIDFTDPEVVEFAPNCNAACINAAVLIRFNTDMSGALLAYSVLNPALLELWQCVNESCLAPVLRVAIESRELNVAPTEAGIPAGRILTVRPRALLAANTFYRVVLAGSVQSRSGVSLVGENFGFDFSWIFRTKNDSTECALSSVELGPAEVTVEVVGSRVPFTAIPRGAPDECSAEGQILTATEYDWEWSTASSAVANYLVGGNLIDTNPELPAACSNQCLFTGSAGVFGRVAVCGDGRACVLSGDCRAGEVCSRGECIEAALGEECDDGNTLGGDGCSGVCLREGTAAPLCGNGVVDQDEDCDGGDGCSASCLNEGAFPSVFGGTTCGNGVVDLGEDCDDGNNASSDGCSSQCLREGSVAGPLALCGNGVVDLGEDCDGGEVCDRTTCLHTGTPSCAPPYPVDGLEDCCGNGDKETGEDCDDGNTIAGDGCSVRCLKEGSSPFYETPSFCGDGGPLGTGEECESGGGDGRIDSFQVAEAIGRGTVTNGRQSTTLTAGANTLTDTASFTLQCGFTNDNQCLDPLTGGPAYQFYGVGSDSCCFRRPWPNFTVPRHESENVCRNPLIRVDFSEKMDLGSFTGHLLLARATAREVCAPGEEEMTGTRPVPPAGVPVGLPLSFWSRTWEHLWSFLSPFGEVLAAPPSPSAPWLQPAAGDGAWCLGSATGRVSGLHHENDPDISSDDRSSLIFTLESGALDPDTWYRVRVVGDREVTDDTIQGVRSANGVGMYGSYEFSFRTGRDICTVDQVAVADESDAELFTRSGEEHPFAATAYTYRGGVLDPIVPVTRIYDWSWGVWTSANSLIVTVPDYAASSVNPNTATVRADGKNGTTTVVARLAITADTLFPESTVGQVVRGAADATVFLCENPGTVILDSAASDTLNNLFVSDAVEFFGNFMTRYCRDAGEEGVAGDLPQMQLQTVAAPPGAVLKEFFLSFAGEVIGFRMVPNPSHLSAARWYLGQGFAGNPAAMTVDGYDAVRDGRTVYVNAANRGGDGNLYTNIYVISHSEGAGPETLTIYEQLLANMQFNVNLLAVQNTGVCEPEGEDTLSCTSDFDCPGSATCSAQKAEIRRDTRRLADLRDTEQALATRCVGAGCDYPQLASGTFVRAFATSAWPSWLETLSSELQTLLPQDPLNRFRACPSGYDTETCFMERAAVECPTGSCFQCPADSHVYQYTSVGPAAYRLETDLEYTDDPWMPPLSAAPGTGATLVANQGSPAICRGEVIGAENVCGDGILGPLEACELGEAAVIACTATVRGVSVPGQIAAECRLDCRRHCSGSGTLCASAADCPAGEQCAGFAARADASCVAQGCGDGVVQPGEDCDDGAQNGLYGFCDTDCSGPAAFCGDGALAGVEQCDLGDDNGQWNASAGTRAVPFSCGWDCSFPGPYCGDNEVNGPEICDGSIERGSGRCANNSQKPCTTNEDCGGAFCGGHCGERLRCTGGGGNAYSVCLSREAGEACSSSGGGGVCRRITVTGGVQHTGAVRCSADPANSTACHDKRVNQTCTVGGASGLCTSYPLERVRLCDSVGADACSRWELLGTSCQVIGEGCGDGAVQYIDTNRNGTRDAGEPGEECDDANTNDYDECTNSCRWNVCGDGILREGVEACDFGAGNGTPCGAPYGGTCNYCSPSCIFVTQAGGFCGDGAVTGTEMCDQSADPILADPMSPPPGFVPNSPADRIDRIDRSVCNASCTAICPPDFTPSPIRFQNPEPATVHTFRSSGEENRLSIPACRLGNGLEFNAVSFGSDVFHFPPPMDVLLVLDNTPSMSDSELRSVRRALCGAYQPDCAALDVDGAIRRLFDSRDAGDVRIGIIEFGGESRYRTWNSGSDAAWMPASYSGVSCDPDDPVPCYDRPTYFGPDNKRGTADDGAPPSADATGLLTNSPANQEALRAVVASLNSDNRATRSYLALHQARTILEAGGANSKVMIYLSDGDFADDCCAYVTPAAMAADPPTSCTTTSERRHCAVPTTMCTVSSGTRECAFSDLEAEAMNRLVDGITVFTASVSSSPVSALMRRWADNDPSGNVTFSYAGTDVPQMFDDILSSIGVQIQVSNNDDFSDSGPAKWMEEITVPESGFGIQMPTSVDFQLACTGTDAWQDLFIRVLYASTGPDADVTVSEPRWSYCPRVD